MRERTSRKNLGAERIAKEKMDFLSKKKVQKQTASVLTDKSRLEAVHKNEAYMLQKGRCENFGNLK